MKSRRRQILWSDAADLDLGRAVSFLRERSPAAARELVRSVVRAVSALAEQPEIGAVVSDIGHEQRYRHLVCGHHRIFYRIQDDTILVVRIWDGRRDPESLKLE